MKLAKDIIHDYISSISKEWEEKGVKEYLERIEKLMLKEVDHILFLKKKFSKISFFLKDNYFKEINGLKTEEDIANYSIQKISETFNKFFK